ncbi:MAG TPA: hypothetical protein VH081_03200 [Solirubrobacteraceae bacterium]|jgi:hypothetical protein|nr:hypothetical protein [Solirubrobacteraceae bacterium]
MSDPIRPDALLRQARVLAGFGAGRGRPRTIDHRRAVSAAYYALYHRLIDACLDLMFPGTMPEAARHAAARWFDHADIADVCKWVLTVATYTQPQQRRPPQVKDNGVWELFSRTVAGGGRRSGVPLSVHFTADAFNTLQQARHTADYDHSASFPKAVARTHVLTAARAVKLIDQGQDGMYMRRFLAMNVARSSRLKRG